MTTPARVLLIGRSKTLLEKMASVLTHFWAVQMLLLDGLGPDLESDLVVICDSVPEPERQDWVWWVRGKSPGMLIVKINGFDSGPHAGADAIVDEGHGPGALVSTIHELLTERGLGSRGWQEQPETAWLQ